MAPDGRESDGFRRRPFRDAMADVLPAKVRLRHQKYQPFPGHILDLAESKNELLAQIDAYGQNECVRSMILRIYTGWSRHFRHQNACARKCSRATNPPAAVSLIMAAHILKAAYLEQHGEPAPHLSRRARLRHGHDHA
ncbi:MAG: hypothetical protein ACR2KT_04990 [Methylocella sp.]